MRQFVIILNGSKGVGKSTLSKELAKKLEGVAFFGFDVVRRMISQMDASDVNNAIAVDVSMNMIEGFLSNGVSVVIDGGINNSERMQKVKMVVDKYDADLFTYTLHAPRETLWKRVQKRDKEWGVEADRERFDYVYDLLEKNVLPNTVILDTAQLTVEKIADGIVRNLKVK